jgi:hypothetical protein
MNIVDFIHEMLDIRGADAKVLNKIPTLIQRAVVKLQRRDLFPSTEMKFLAGEKVETELRNDGSVAYRYTRLPKDFREIDKFNVEDTRYFWYDKVYDIENQSRVRNQPLFTIVEELDDLSDSRIFKLVLQPYPDPNKEVSVKYYIDGSQESFSRITNDYWDAILTTIESDLGMRSQESADSEVNDTVNQTKHREGFDRFNQTIRTTKPSFFASKRRR